MARGLKFRIYVVEGLYYLCSENKGADQLRGYREADLRLCFRICKKPVFLRCGSITVGRILLRDYCGANTDECSCIIEFIKRVEEKRSDARLCRASVSFEGSSCQLSGVNIIRTFILSTSFLFIHLLQAMSSLADFEAAYDLRLMN